jgi:hypothetical protein
MASIAEFFVGFGVLDMTDRTTVESGQMSAIRREGKADATALLDNFKLEGSAGAFLLDLSRIQSASRRRGQCGYVLAWR